MGFISLLFIELLHVLLYREVKTVPCFMKGIHNIHFFYYPVVLDQCPNLQARDPAEADTILA